MNCLSCGRANREIARFCPGCGKRSDLDARIEALRRTELVEADTGWFLDEPALRFHHLLIRDALQGAGGMVGIPSP